MANNGQGSARARLAAAALTALALFAGTAGAVRKSDVLNSKHNLSATPTNQAYAPTRTVTAVSETQICVFCHTPHAATITDQGGATLTLRPLWNRRVPAATTYTGYTSSSLDAAVIQAGFNGQPGGSSKLCLSCHDGTLAVNTVNVLNGATGSPGVNISMTGGVTTLPAGTYGATSAYTPVIGTDLRNDHPISVDFTSTLAARDGELRPVNNTALQNWQSGGVDIIGKRGPGYRPLLPLEGTGAGGTGQIQCAACHDPHIVETDTTKGNQHFLRTNRFQEAAPTATYSQANDTICLGCHDKNGAAGVWAYSAHGNPLVAPTQTYTAAAVVPRDFPANIPVWKAACQNCHNGHTTQGAYHLLVEGTDGALVSGTRQGGNRAEENTCYQCHDGTATVISTALENIKGDFALARHMPIASTEQRAATEVHDVGGNFADGLFVDCTTTTNICGADGIERRSLLGVGVVNNRHAECSDCHNPHRIVKFMHFNGNAGAISGAPDAAGTHTHTDTAGYTHDNIASGVLRGTWGVEPTYGSRSFQSLPSGYVVKRGDPGNSAVTTVASTYVTREYQVCLKCHSDYGYSDDNVYPAGTNRPTLVAPGTPTNTMNMTRYTNQAKEFQSPPTHQNCENPACALGTDAGASASYNSNNHRSWHPVMLPTLRHQADRRVTVAGAFLDPWNTGQGNQTMYCDDCHGSNTTSTTSVIPDATKPWGPHGSTQNFILKGQWDNTTSATSSAFCMKCHNGTVYNAGSGTGSQTTGWWLVGMGEGHALHFGWLNRMRCNWCHVAVPHGWKNKSLLVNLNDVGPEAGLAVGTNVGTGPYNNGPYYVNAYLKVNNNNFMASGQWDQNKATNCDHGHGNPP